MEPTENSEQELAAIAAEYPALPSDYFAFLREVGWGETPTGRMIYSGPLAPGDIYSGNDELAHVVLLGDDYQGYCLGYDLIAMAYGEVDPRGNWAPWPIEKGIKDYVQG